MGKKLEISKKCKKNNSFLMVLCPDVGAKVAPRRPNMAPKWPQDGQRWSQDGPKTAQDGPKTAQDGFLSAKMAEIGA